MIMEQNEMKEMMPVYRNIIIDIYDENPYKINETEDGLELSDEFINSDSGQVSKKDFYIECAKVIEVGPKCEFVKAGDDVMIDIRSISPIPFYKNCWWLVDEQAVKAVINEGLKNRLKK